MNRNSKFKKSESVFIQGTCIVCKKNKQESKGVSKSTKSYGKKVYKSKCSTCSGEDKRRPWAFHKKPYCENCGFIAIHRCQLDVDHIDGNPKNNNIDNYQTLCSNCHRLKTYVNSDWEKK